MSDKKQVFLSLETARLMYNSKDKTLKNFALENFTKEELEAKGLPVKFEQIGKLKGYYIDSCSKIHKLDNDNDIKYSNAYTKNTFPSLELAEASLALSQLLQLREVYNNGWKHEPSIKPNEEVTVIRNRYSNAELDTFQGGSTFNYILVFKYPNIAKQFFENFYDLINQALPLL